MSGKSTACHASIDWPGGRRPVRFSVLGELTVTDAEGRPLGFGEGRVRKRGVRHLLSVLALRDWALSAEQLRSLLWDDDPPESTSAPRTLVYRARRLLPRGEESLATEVDHAGVQRYRLVRGPGDEFDVEEFGNAATLADKERRRGNLERAASLYEEALALWRNRPGEAPLPDFPPTAAMDAYLAPLLTRRVQVTEALVETRLDLGRHGPGLAEQISGFLAFDPLNERLHALRMLDLHRTGRRAEALLAFRHAAESFERLLETSPGARLERMRDRIRADDPALLWRPRQRSPQCEDERPPDLRARPTARGVVDVTLGGKDNYAADRAFIARIIKETGTDTWKLSGEKRDCVVRMIRYIGGRGVRQFLDLGTGMPDPEGRDVHRIARQVAPDARLLLVDNDPNVGAYANALMADGEGIVFRELDLRDVDAVLREARSHLDFGEPVGLLCVNTLQHLGDTGEDLGTGALVEALGRYSGALPPGSLMAVTHISDDGLDPRLRPYLDARDPGSVFSLYLRSPAQIERLFCGLPLVEPGLVDVGRWRPDQPWTERKMRIIGGVAEVRGGARAAR
ncbi:hypothetical protein GNZ18_31070 [Actinomadura sp. NEAU-AAG5]|uniref:Bacterial transcriptional activator domain-containing protein n=1 Tax=Actinomadura litoris TaxID=2678616 RepID=A0A7K1L9Y5_9ACTN|nr:hypothetical protein [Actinomadura litoris]